MARVLRLAFTTHVRSRFIFPQPDKLLNVSGDHPASIRWTRFERPDRFGRNNSPGDSRHDLFSWAKRTLYWEYSALEQVAMQAKRELLTLIRHYF